MPGERGARVLSSRPHSHSSPIPCPFAGAPSLRATERWMMRLPRRSSDPGSWWLGATGARLFLHLMYACVCLFVLICLRVRALVPDAPLEDLGAWVQARPFYAVVACLPYGEKTKQGKRIQIACTHASKQETPTLPNAFK